MKKVLTNNKYDYQLNKKRMEQEFPIRNALSEPIALINI